MTGHKNKTLHKPLPKPQLKVKPLSKPKLDLGLQSAILSRSSPTRISRDLRLINQGEDSLMFRRLVRKSTKDKIKKLKEKVIKSGGKKK